MLYLMSYMDRTVLLDQQGAVSFGCGGSDASTSRWYNRIIPCIFYSCCSHLEHRASVKSFVSLQFRNLRHSVEFHRRGISPSQGRYLTKTQNTDIHALSGIRTHDPSVRAGEDISCHRPRGHSERQSRA
jgi:hypothetical protein